MAQTDPQDPSTAGNGPYRFRFVDWVKSFFGGARFIVSRGNTQLSSQLPGVVKAAQGRYHDRYAKDFGDPTLLSRMEESRQKNMVWDNEIAPLLYIRLSRMFHPDNFKRMKLTMHTSSNPMRRVIEDLSILYENPAMRQLVDDTVKQDEVSKDVSAEDPNAPVIPSKDKTAVPPDDNSKDPVKKAAPDAKVQPPAVPEPPTAPTPDDVGTGNPNVDQLADVLDLEGAQHSKVKSPLDAVLELEDLDVVLDLVEKKVRFHDAIWVRPIVSYENVEYDAATNADVGDPKTAKLSYAIYDPSCADVVPDPNNPHEALCFFYWADEYDDDGKCVTYIHLYSKTEYMKFDTEWTQKARATHNYGRLPVAVFRKELPSQNSYYVNGCGRDLFEGTLELCSLRTIENQRFKDSGFKQLVMQNVDPEDVPADQVMGGPTPIYVPEGANATVLDLQPMLDEMDQMVMNRQLELVAKYGISADEYKVENAPQSGFAKKLDQQKVLKENRRIRKFFKKGEEDLYNLLAVTINEHNIEGVPTLDPEAKYEVDFAEPTYEENPKEQASIDAQNLKLNKTSIIDILKKDNPDLTEVELVRLAERNRRINSVFVSGDQMKLVDLLAVAGTGAGSAMAAHQGGAPAGDPFGGAAGGGGAPPGAAGGGKPPFGKGG